ncbi:MAG: hypothetical protein M1812_007846 [Candelaria pacifica]|nr:MAG: hypothetical protein M1812_007846 [Candelaria pacifica]
MVRINTVWSAILMRTIVTGSFADCVSKASALSTNIASYETEQVLHPDDEFAQDVEDYKAAPQNPQVLLLADDSFFTVPTDLTIHDTLLHEMSLGKALELAKVKAMELNLKQVASDIKLWVEHHPWKAAFYAASAIGFFAPEILSISALEALGFGITGVRAGMSKLFTFEVSYANQNRGRLGSLASKIQSVIGPVAARSVFCNLAECKNGWLRSRVREWWSKSVDSFDGRCGGCMQSSEGLQRAD